MSWHGVLATSFWNLDFNKPQKIHTKNEFELQSFPWLFRCALQNSSRSCNCTSTVLPVVGVKMNRILKFFRKCCIMVGGINLCTAPILCAPFKLGEGLGCEGILGQFFSPKKVKGSLGEKKEAEVDLGRLPSLFIDPVRVIDSVLLSRASLRISVVHKQSFSFLSSAVK